MAARNLVAAPPRSKSCYSAATDLMCARCHSSSAWKSISPDGASQAMLSPAHWTNSRCRNTAGSPSDANVPLLAKLAVPDMPATVAPLVFAIPVQLIAYHVAAFMGKDVDQPRNLAKSVTVE